MLTTTAASVTTTIELGVSGELDLTRSAAFPADAAPVPAEPGTLRLAFPREGAWEHVGVFVRQRAPDAVSLEIAAPPGAADAVAGQVRRILSLDLDGGGFSSAVAGDPVVRTLRERNPGLRPMLFHSPYEAACWAVICARLRVGQAALLRRRLAERLGESVTVGGRTLLSFPAPARLATLDELPGLSQQKARRLVEIAGAAEAGALDAVSLLALPVEDALERVRALPGIGPFSAELVVVRGAGHPDVFPAHELRLHTVLAAAYGTGDVAELEEIAQRWRPYRSWAVALLRSVGAQDRAGQKL
ncbi:DNA-3-methyladenine glycosylase family protein [Prauserella cavernicola]|uniref:DNA-3-methyladenine glycosylase II n=1 Tax=Prauserella cavernicola TaxID=2800127 RepID=A0A934QVE6_9PSEU|nr:DNA-3-methyladenine glycosylase 2 family protein [Prauserella cavernicola]MBK1786038.1 DNA-3-methyladenine glycosylase 2 family protein [Prauserella cavernicola]